jgi:hypothetical protein
MTSMTSRADAMAYRERVAWLSLFAMAATLGPYLALTAMNSHPVMRSATRHS